MEQNLATVLLFISILAVLAIMFVALLNYRIKRQLIRSGVTDEAVVKTLSRLRLGLSVNPLKWGLLLLSGGVGLVVLEFIPARPDSPLPYGVEAIFLATGLLAYYFIQRRQR